MILIGGDFAGPMPKGPNSLMILVSIFRFIKTVRCSTNWLFNIFKSSLNWAYEKFSYQQRDRSQSLQEIGLIKKNHAPIL